MPKKIQIAPSILAADPLHMFEAVETAVAAGADWLHVDIMDGHFVPNLSYGPSLVKALKKAFPQVFLDVHLMVSDPQRWIGPFSDAGATSLTVHVETVESPEILRDIHRRGIHTGISLKPATPVEALADYLPDAEQVLIMTVEPGFGGQKLIESCAGKAAALRQRGYTGFISCDGGVTEENAAGLAALGADTLVMGTTFFRAEDPAKLAAAVHAL